MKKTFEILKVRPTIHISLTRDSVSAGDDCHAPHEKIVCVHSFLDPEALAREVSSGYLPSINGVNHSWVCVLNDTKIAEIKTSMVQPLVHEVEFKDENYIHFVYISSKC